MAKKTLYFDMDGVLAKYDYGLYIPKREGQVPPFMQLGSHVFVDIEPEANVVQAFERLYERYKGSKKIGIKVFTCIPVGLLQAEHTIDKFRWCRFHISLFDSNDFFCTSVPKHDAVSESLWTLTKDDILIDDYNKNLDNWTAHGGTAIKCLNGINSINDKYDYIETSWSPDEIVKKLNWLLL